MHTPNDLVSIVTPVYNAAEFLEDTVKTVQNQTHDNWELIFVNDKSPDNSVDIIKKLQKNDSRIKLIHLNENSGAAIARNTGTKNAKGRYLAFLDADDLWNSDKLRVQIEFMTRGGYGFSYTSYEFANQQGRSTGKIVSIPPSITYKQALKNPIIWTSTVMLDLYKISTELAIMPNVRRGQDAATWWSILRETDEAAYGITTPLAYYRRTNSSLSANKLKAIKRTWYLYRYVEKLSFVKSAYVFTFYSFNAIKKRV